MKYAIVLDRRTDRVIIIKLNPADFPDEEIEECDWEQILYPYEDEFSLEEGASSSYVTDERGNSDQKDS